MDDGMLVLVGGFREDSGVRDEGLVLIVGEDCETGESKQVVEVAVGVDQKYLRGNCVRICMLLDMCSCSCKITYTMRGGEDICELFGCVLTANGSVSATTP